MKKLQKHIAICLVLILTLGFIQPVKASDYSNFTVSQTYSPFADVPADSWFYPGVKTAYELGLMKGTSATTFNPNGNLSVAEAVTLAVRLYQIYNEFTPTEPAPTGPWYQNYIDFAVSFGILNGSYFADYNAPINRTDFASIYSGIIPDTDEIINPEITLLNIPDVDNGTFEADSILTMYAYGIMTGDNALRFFPKSTITRAEVATIAARMAVPAQRKQLTLAAPTNTNTNANANTAIAEKHVNRDYEWFVDQNQTGTYSYENCGPSVTSMILKWFSPANNVTAETLRSWIRPNGGWWFTDDIESVMNSYQVPYERKPFNDISQIIADLNKDRIILVCLDGYYLSDDYTSVGSGHFLIIKGYINQNGAIEFETYNPDSRKDHYYPADKIFTACQKWWAYYYAIGY